LILCIALSRGDEMKNNRYKNNFHQILTCHERRVG
jgi:hypothetical protein